MPIPEVNEAAKTVADNGPFVGKNLVPTLWMLGVSLLGGIVSFLQKVKAGKSRPMNITELVGEMMTSALVGLVTYWICRAYGVNEYLAAAGVAISGHMGARAIFIFEQAADRVVPQWLAGKTGDGEKITK
jgi:hypothetical protein